MGAKTCGTEQLLFLSAAILLCAWLVVRRLWQYAPSANSPQHAAAAVPQASLSNLGNVVRLLLQSRYLLLLVGLVGISKMISTLIYYQFNPFIEQMFPGQDAKTAFTGLFFGWMNVASFVIQFFLTSWMLRRLGLSLALLALPIGLLGSSLGLLLIPAFWLAATAELYDGSLNYSLQQTSKEVLYLPIDRSIRYKVKPFIDMVVFRFGKGIAAIIGILWLDVLRLDARALSYLTIPLIVGWLVLILQLRHDYIRTIRSILQARAVSRRRQEKPSAVMRSEGALAESEQLEAWLESLAPHHRVQRKLLLAGQLVAVDGFLTEEAKAFLESLAQYEQWPPQFDGLPHELVQEQFKECLTDRHEPAAKRRYAIRRLIQQDGQETADCLLGMLMVEEDALIRQELIRGLTKLRIRSPRLEFPKRVVRRQIAKEVRTYQRIIQFSSLCHRMAPDLSNEQDPAVGLLRLLTEETLQQIFRLLALVYRPDDIYLIYNQLREPDAYVRADALELLDNLVDPGLRWLIFPVLDENRFLERVDGEGEEPAFDGKEAHRLFQQGIWDHNRWLGIVIICVAGRLDLRPLLDEMDREAPSQCPLLCLAAKAARRLAMTSMPP